MNSNTQAPTEQNQTPTLQVIITRADPMAGFPDPENTKPGILSQETFDSWDAAFAALSGYGVPLTDEHRAEIKQHPETQFQHMEFINFVHSACTVNVMYDIRVNGGAL